MSEHQHPVIHFEMPFDDAERAATFFADAFGWEITRFGEEMGNYVTLGTCASDSGRPTQPGAINGGLYPRRDGAPTPGVTIGCADVDAAAAKVTAAGGTVFGEPMDIPGIGRYLAFADTEGNPMSLLQPEPPQG